MTTTTTGDLGLASQAGAMPEAGLDSMFEKARAASALLKALSHESRLLILCLLAQRERTVTELEAALALRQPTVSQQLARLRAEGLVTTRRNGKQVHYRLASAEAEKILAVVYEVFCGNLAH